MEGENIIQEENNSSSEFSKSNLKTSFKRTMLMTFALILYVVGFISAAAMKSKIVGVIILLFALAIVGQSIYQSSQDLNALKWLNVIFKSILFLGGVGLLIFIIMA